MTHFTIPSLLVLLSFAAGHAQAGEAAIPETWPAERYANMSRQSPFALATAAPVAAAPRASFAENWFVGGIGRLGTADYVSIKSRDLSSQFSLYGHEPNAEGVALAEVQWSEAVGRSTVILRKGNETARLEFNEADVRGPAPAKPSEAKKTAATGAGGGAGAAATGTAAANSAQSVPPLPAAPPAGGIAADYVRRRVRPIGAP